MRFVAATLVLLVSCTVSAAEGYWELLLLHPPKTAAESVYVDSNGRVGLNRQTICAESVLDEAQLARLQHAIDSIPPGIPLHSSLSIHPSCNDVDAYELLVWIQDKRLQRITYECGPETDWLASFHA